MIDPGSRFGCKPGRVWREEEGGYEVGIWGPGDAHYGWLFVARPVAPWQHRDFNHLAFTHPDGKSVLITAQIQTDNSRWMHLSVSRQNRIPSYKDLSDAKEIFIGPNRGALQLFMPQSEHVNIHPFTLHLWMPVGRWPLPDFAPHGTI